jgi:hypothetical protein
MEPAESRRRAPRGCRVRGYRTYWTNPALANIQRAEEQALEDARPPEDNVVSLTSRRRWSPQTASAFAEDLVQTGYSAA